MAAADFTPETPTEQQVARFWSKADQSGGPDACWPWLGSSITAGGYGHVGVRIRRGVFKTFGAHVIARWIATGEWPGALCTLHACDYRRCVNPNHLFLGTHKDNAQDMIRKGRRYANAPKGVDVVALVKLSEADVLEIRRLHAAGLVSKAGLARQFSVSRFCIYDIIDRFTWKHLA